MKRGKRKKEKRRKAFTRLCGQILGFCVDLTFSSVVKESDALAELLVSE